MTQALNRKERERRRHREEVLEAAEVIFAEKGFHRCTMEDVAERAEFSIGTLYNFFSSKEELYRSLMEMRIQQLNVEANAALDETGSPEELIQAYIQAKIGLSSKYESFAKLYTRESMGDRFSNAELWRELMGPFFEQVLERLTGAFQEGIEAGRFRNDLDPVDMTIALGGMTDEFMFEWLVNPERVKLEEKYDVICGLIFDGVRSHK
ncbi:MAG: TetR/AcrR family transcriptional regulator [Planctomycetes bacterium]|nr:TetR/AcrR family transcriptional regulator [Planctomycetota bacterium]